MTGRDFRVVFLTALAHGQAHLFILAFGGVAIPLSLEFGLSDAEIGWFGTLAPVLFGLGALPASLLVDRIGARAVIVVYLVGASIASLVIALSSTLHQALIGFALLGIFGSFYHPAGLTLLTRTVRMRGKALGYHGMAGSIAIFTAPVLAGWLADAFDTWRAAYLALVIPGLLLVPGVLLLRTEDGGASMEKSGDGEGSTWPVLIALFGLLLILGFVYRGTLTFLPKFLQESIEGPIFGFFHPDMPAATRAGQLAGLTLVSGVLGQWIGGNLSQRFSLPSLCLTLTILTTVSLILMGVLPGNPLIVVTAAFGFFYFMLQPVGNGLVARYTSSRRRSLAFGIAFTLSFGVGAAGSAATGVISEEFGGLSSGMLANGFVMSIGVVAAIVLLKMTRQPPREPPA
ncbi:MAG: MFS transporter [Planctomycetota bacterium]|nr:MFS transporter [Planctomycetota bacterium]